MLFGESHRYGEPKEVQIEMAVPFAVVMALAATAAELAVIHFFPFWLVVLLTVNLWLLFSFFGLGLGLVATQVGDVSSAAGLLAGATLGTPLGIVLAIGVATVGWEVCFWVILGIATIDAFRRHIIVIPRRQTSDATSSSARPSTAQR